MKLLQGSRLGRYIVQTPIGAGGMGEVFLGFDPLLERNVALKVLPVSVAGDPSRLKRFVREAKAASALNHPNILTVHEIGFDSGLHFLATEYVEGRTLKDWAEQHRPGIEEVLDVGIQTASALAAAHRAGIIHRDIKPENLMWRDDGYIKVLDFGIAKLTSASDEMPADTAIETRPLPATEPGTILGTARYMSPEQAAGTVVDARTDLWSLGIVLYELLAGRVPYEGHLNMKVILDILRKDVPPLEPLAPHAPAELVRIVMKALTKDLGGRYQSATDLAGDLDRLREELRYASRRDASRVYRGERRRATEPTAPSRTPTTTLPPFSVQLIGRDRELAEVVEILRDPAVRLLTLTGIGGTGKTCLARHAAREVQPEFADGAFLVDLATLTDPELVAYTVAQTLGVKDAGGGTIGDALKDFLREKRMLLVLDNFEQVAAAAPLVADLLSSAPGIKALITSRALLHLSAEHEYGVPPLGLPSPADLATHVPLEELMQCAAVALFVERAKAARPGFALTRENAKAIAEICTRLDGLPLALELAAARVKVLQPQAILARLENRLKLLTGGARDLPSRQQTMRGAIAWSYDLLDEAEKTLLRRLSVFAGGCTLEAAEAVCDVDGDLGTDVLDGLTSLGDKSLVTQREQGDELRFRMLELVREFARESLEQSGEADLMATRLEGYFLAMAEESNAELGSSTSAGWTARFDREHENLRAALAHAIESNPENAFRLAGTLARFWKTRGYLLEGRRWCERALAASGAAAPTAAKARMLVGLGELTWRLGDLETALASFEEGLRIGREVDDKRMIGEASSGVGLVHLLSGNVAEGRARLEETIALARELGNGPLAAKALNNLGELSRMEGDFEAARALYEASLTENGSFPEVTLTSIASFNLGALALEADDCPTARKYFRASLAAAREVGFMIGIHAALEGFSLLAAAEGEMRRAARLFGATEAMRAELGFNTEAVDEGLQKRFHGAARAELGDEAFEAATLEGRALRLQDAIALAQDDSPAA